MTGNAWWTLIGLIALLSIILHHNLLFLMSLLLALVGGMSLLWKRACLVGVSYRRRFSNTRLFYGEETDLYIEIVNAKPLPLAWLRAEDEFPGAVELLTGKLHYSHRPNRRLLTNLLSLRWYERVTRHYRLRGSHRGAWEFGPVEITSGDIFGFSVQRETLPERQTLLVYPKIVPLTALGLPARHPFGDFKTPRRVMEDPLRLMGAREYVPGDSFRHIHWKATARRQQLQTKVFEPSATRPLAIFMNINTYDRVYEGLDQELQEYAITTAASIARWGWDEGLQIGLYVNSVTQPGGQRIRIRPGSHPDQLIWILEALSRVVMYGRWPIEAILQAEAMNLRYGTTIVVVTPVVNQYLRHTLADLRQREHGVTLITLGQAELDPPLPGIRHYHIGGHEEWHELASLALA
ncbi:MAG: DUF58 domain-containing protein [Anaerolineae bacterium]|nr:DUF58 domain-containing protein [Anaerolineae bacterium]